MTVGAALLLYAALAGTLGPLLVRRGTWLARAPRLGAALLLAAAWSVLTALFLAGLTIALPDTALSTGLGHVLGACIIRLRSAYATPAGAAAAGAGLTLSAAIAARTGWACVRVLRARVGELRGHRQLIALAGRPMPDRDVVVLDDARPAAYCLAGRGGAVVLTRGAVELLSAAELAAVLAHERAHRDAGHHRLLAAAALAGRALPELPLTRDLARDVRRLLEMHADDLAAAGHDPETLATALVAVATARPARTRLAALAAADSDAAARVRRLLVPAARLSPGRRATVRAVTIALGVLPLLLALTPGAVAATEPPVRQSRSVQVVAPGAGHAGPAGIPAGPA